MRPRLPGARRGGQPGIHRARRPSPDGCSRYRSRDRLRARARNRGSRGTRPLHAHRARAIHPVPTVASEASWGTCGTVQGHREERGTDGVGKLRDPDRTRCRSRSFPCCVALRVRRGTHGPRSALAPRSVRRIARRARGRSRPVAPNGEGVGLAGARRSSGDPVGFRRPCVQGGLGLRTWNLPPHTTSAEGAFVLLVRLGSSITIPFSGCADCVLDAHSTSNREGAGTEAGADGDRGGWGAGPIWGVCGTDWGARGTEMGETGDSAFAVRRRCGEH